MGRPVSSADAMSGRRACPLSPLACAPQQRCLCSVLARSAIRIFGARPKRKEHSTIQSRIEFAITVTAKCNRVRDRSVRGRQSNRVDKFGRGRERYGTIIVL